MEASGARKEHRPQPLGMSSRLRARLLVQWAGTEVAECPLPVLGVGPALWLMGGLPRAASSAFWAALHLPALLDAHPSLCLLVIPLDV